MKFLNTFKLFESVSEQEKIESIDSFDEYLREIFHEDHPHLYDSFYNYWRIRYRHVRPQSGDKLDELITQQTIETLYPLSLSKRHNKDLIFTIKDILADLEDDDFLKLDDKVRLYYDPNIKNGEQLIPRFSIQYTVKPKSHWARDYKKLIIDGKEKYSPVYEKYEMFLGYGLKITHVSSTKISFSQII